MPLNTAFYGFFGEDPIVAWREEDVTFGRAYAFVCPGCLKAWGYRYHGDCGSADSWIIWPRWCADCVPSRDQQFRNHEQGSLLLSNDLLCDVKDLPPSLCIQELINYDECSKIREQRRQYQGSRVVPALSPSSRPDDSGLQRRATVWPDLREAHSGGAR